jgi:hypothetical protein
VDAGQGASSFPFPSAAVDIAGVAGAGVALAGAVEDLGAGAAVVDSADLVASVEAAEAEGAVQVAAGDPRSVTWQP